MGGRGSSSGMSDKGKRYGTEYTTLYESDNIKFVKYNNGSATAPMETMTKDRIYVTLSYNDEPKYISYYDSANKRYEQIDLDHEHKIDGKPEKPHTHKGYFHDEKGSRGLNNNEKKILAKAMQLWNNRAKK